MYNPEWAYDVAIDSGFAMAMDRHLGWWPPYDGTGAAIPAALTVEAKDCGCCAVPTKCAATVGVA